MAKVISTAEITGESIIDDVPILDTSTPLADNTKMYVNIERTFRQVSLSKLSNWIKTKINGSDITPRNIRATGTITSGGSINARGDINIPTGAKYMINGVALSASDVNAVPRYRKVNNKSLSSDIVLNASDVGAVPTSRTVNGKALSNNISLNASDVGAVPRSVACYANSRIDTFDSNGNVTVPLSSFGITTGQKPVGILMSHQNGAIQDTAGRRKVILQYDYDNSTNSQVVIRAHYEGGTPATGNIRYFAMVFQGSWLSP